MMRKSRVTIAFVVAFVLAAFVLPNSGIASSLKQESLSYVVQRGDNLSSIASRYGSSVGAIVQANGLASTVIRPGQTLLIPAGSGSGSVSSGSRVSGSSTGASTPASGSYVVQSGESLWSIASRYGVSLSALRALNGLSGDVILPGQTLAIPASSGGATGSRSMVVSPPQPASPASACSGSYIVQPGDTLYSIAGRCGVAVRLLREANGIVGSAIYRGQTLTIPSGTASIPWSPGVPAAVAPPSAAVPVQTPVERQLPAVVFPTAVPPFPPLSYPTPGP